MLDKQRIVYALYEISLAIQPKEPENLLRDFLKLVMRKFEFSYAFAEIPDLGIRIEIPRNGNCTERISFDERICRVSFGRDRTIPEIYHSALKSVVDRLSYTLEYIMLAEEKYRRLFQNSGDVIVLVDDGGVVMEQNPAAIKVLGDMVGKKIDRKWLRPLVEHSGRFYSSATYDIPKLGKQIIARDITERLLLEERLKAEKEFIGAIIETANSLIVGLDEDGRIVLFNKKCEEVTGWKKEEAIGKNWFDVFIPEEDRERVLMEFERLKNGEHLIGMQPIITKDGKRIITWANTLVKRDSQKIVVGIGIDITDEVEARKRVEELVETLRIINRILRHDLLNDLCVVGGWLEVFKDTEDKKLVDQALKSIERSAELINRMRELENLVSTGENLKPYNVGDVVKKIVEKYGIQFKIEGNCIALADDALSSVIDNIVRNAIVHGKTDRIDITIGRKDDLCEIRIADYGKGIPDEIKDRIFEEGFVYGDTGHSGLGLYIAKKVVERYGGNIRVEDNEPNGIVFIVELRSAK
jgi:PAS domain S-box-containing protein